MPNLKDNILSLSKPEQYEIYEAIEASLFGTISKERLSDEQMLFIEERLSIIESEKASFLDPDQLKSELDIMLK